MTWKSYLNEFDKILNSPSPLAPYNDPEYLNYTKLNHTRLSRWLKIKPITDDTKDIIEKIKSPQEWIVITEPWCGDAAHITPILYQMALLNTHIKFTIQLRDENSEIDKYLTNGSKSIPILVVRNEQGKDLFHWGPRPAPAQALYADLINSNSDFETVKEALQKFYNSDKSISIQKEVARLISGNE